MQSIIYHGYLVYSNGTIMKKSGSGFLKPVNSAFGYKMVGLKINGKMKSKSIHRLMAEIFIPNPDNLPQVNHKDGNKENNDISNLEWMTRAQNSQHAYDNGLLKQCFTKDRQPSKRYNRPILQFNLNNDLIAEHTSTATASRSTNIPETTIHNNCIGVSKSVRKKYIFRYKFETREESIKTRKHHD